MYLIIDTLLKYNVSKIFDSQRGKNEMTLVQINWFVQNWIYQKTIYFYIERVSAMYLIIDTLLKYKLQALRTTNLHHI